MRKTNNLIEECCYMSINDKIAEMFMAIYTEEEILKVCEMMYFSEVGDREAIAYIIEEHGLDSKAFFEDICPQYRPKPKAVKKVGYYERIPRFRVYFSTNTGINSTSVIFGDATLTEDKALDEANTYLNSYFKHCDNTQNITFKINRIEKIKKIERRMY